jgi:hypothetical protein
MAVKTLYLTDALASGANHYALQDGGSAPAANYFGNAHSNSGWNFGNNAAPRYAYMDAGNEINRTNITATTNPAAAIPNNTIGDSFRIPLALSGTFPAGNWPFSWLFRSGSAAFAGRFQIRVRVWRSTDPTGAGATQVTTADIILGPSTANVSLTANTTLAGTWAAPQIILDNEYLFFQVIGQTTTAGTATGQDVNFYKGVATITTPNFSPAAQSIALQVAEMVLLAPALAVSPGEALIALDPADLLLGTPAAVVDIEVPTETIPLQVAELVLNAPALTVEPGEASVALDPAELVLLAPALGIAPGEVQLPMSTAELLLSAQALDVVPGAPTIALDPAELTLNAPALTAAGGPVDVVLQAAELDLQAQSLSVLPGEAQLALQAALLDLDAPDLAIITPFGPQFLNMQPAELTLEALPLTVEPGEAQIALDPAELTLVGPALGIEPGATTVELQAALLNLLAQNVRLDTGIDADPASDRYVTVPRDRAMAALVEDRYIVIPRDR